MRKQRGCAFCSEARKPRAHRGARGTWGCSVTFLDGHLILFARARRFT